MAAKLGAETGRRGGLFFGKTGFKILSPDKIREAKEITEIAHKGQTFFNTGGRLFHSPFLAIDVGTKSLLHLHLWFTEAHLQLGTALGGILGGL